MVFKCKGLSYRTTGALRREEMFGIDHRQALSSLLREFNVPIIMDLDIGHMSPMMPVVCGSMADVSFDGSSFTISYDIEQ